MDAASSRLLDHTEKLNSNMAAHVNRMDSYSKMVEQQSAKIRELELAMEAAASRLAEQKAALVDVRATERSTQREKALLVANYEDMAKRVAELTAQRTLKEQQERQQLREAEEANARLEQLVASKVGSAQGLEAAVKRLTHVVSAEVGVETLQPQQLVESSGAEELWGQASRNLQDALASAQKQLSGGACWEAFKCIVDSVEAEVAAMRATAPLRTDQLGAILRCLRDDIQQLLELNVTGMDELLQGLLAELDIVERTRQRFIRAASIAP